MQLKLLSQLLGNNEEGETKPNAWRLLQAKDNKIEKLKKSESIEKILFKQIQNDKHINNTINGLVK